MSRFTVNPPRRKTKLVYVLTCAAAWCVMASCIGWAGTIEGTVRFAGSQVEKKLKVTIDSYICGEYQVDESLVLSSGKGIRNAVVSLVLPPSAREEARLPPVEARMDQKKCAFVPHVLVTPVGGTLKFLSTLFTTSNRSRRIPDCLFVSKIKRRSRQMKQYGDPSDVAFNLVKMATVVSGIGTERLSWVFDDQESVRYVVPSGAWKSSASLPTTVTD